MQNPRRACKLSSLVQCDGVVQILHHCAARSYSVHYRHLAWVTTGMRMCSCTRLCNMQHDHVHAWTISSFVNKTTESQEALLIVYCDQCMLVFPKRSHRCLFCPSRVHQEAKKAEVISKSRQNFWTKRFQQNSHNTYVDNNTESLMVPDFQHINEVCSSYLSNRHTQTHKTTTLTLAHALRVNDRDTTTHGVKWSCIILCQK